MADSKQCASTDVHDFHGWSEPAPEAPLGRVFHVCGGIGAPPQGGASRRVEEGQVVQDGFRS